jgi:hypothetical protein
MSYLVIHFGGIMQQNESSSFYLDWGFYLEWGKQQLCFWSGVCSKINQGHFLFVEYFLLQGIGNLFFCFALSDQAVMV